MANTAASVLNEAQRHVGITGRPNVFTRNYANRHGDVFLRAAWCDMFVTYVARQVGAKAVLPSGDRAYTVWHAEDFQRIGAWYSGTSSNIRKYAAIGDVVFFDWNGTDNIQYIDHVGYVLRNLGDGRVVTVEGNTADAVKLRVRGPDVIAGFGKPKYDKPTVTIKPVSAYPYKAGTYMRKGWTDSKGVTLVQKRLNELKYAPKLGVDGDFGIKTHRGVRWFQEKNGLVKDGVVGPKTWAKLFPAKA